jgi:hypothetical protein
MDVAGDGLGHGGDLGAGHRLRWQQARRGRDAVEVFDDGQ